MSKLSKKVLSEITTNRITPIPKWQFLLKDIFVWGLALFGVIFGAVSIAIVIHQTTSPDYAPIHTFSDALTFIPYFWIAMLVVFVYVAYHNFLHTEKGYRFKTVRILGGAITLALVLGALLATTGAGGKVNTLLSQKIPFYSKYADMRAYVWMNPTEGRLAGKIVSIDTEKKSFVLNDLNEHSWTISYSDALIRPSVDFSVGSIIKIIGKRVDENTFFAQEIRPWTGSGYMMQGNVKGMRINR